MTKISDDQMTVRSLVEEIGQDVIERATGCVPRNMRHWKKDGIIPAKHAVTLDTLAGRRLPSRRRRPTIVPRR